jgi:hypothetical protein
MIKIEVTGNSIAEVADKLLAIGSSLRATPAERKFGKVVELGMGYGAQSIDPVMPEVAEAAPADPTPSQPTSETSTSTPDTSSDTEQNSTPPASASEPAVNADLLRDLVLAVVAAKGRDAMVAVLDTFGVAKASDVPADQSAELVAALEALL